MHEHTLGGLKNWYKHYFNKVGYVFLFSVKGHSEKRIAFLAESEVLTKALNEKIEKVSGHDLKRDLQIMVNNVGKMHEIVKNHNMSLSDKVNFNGYEGDVEPLTYHSITRMYRRSLEKLGWALLGTSHGHSGKLSCLMGSFSYLHVCLNEMIVEFKDKDRKHDLEIMHDDVKTVLSIIFTKDKVGGSLSGTIPTGIMMSPMGSPRESQRTSPRQSRPASIRGGSGRRSVQVQQEQPKMSPIGGSPNRTASTSMSSKLSRSSNTTRPASSRASMPMNM